MVINSRDYENTKRSYSADSELADILLPLITNLLSTSAEPVEAVQTSGLDASWETSFGGFLSMFTWEETPGSTQNPL